jgi:UDP-2,3-diacylglucosamine hydrolase
MKTIFISDLHLEENQPQIIQQFTYLLNSIDATSVDALYILGDLFEAWIGDDDDTPLHQAIIRLLAETVKKVPVYLLHGNRDFLLGNRFIKQSGCIILPDESIIDLYGQRVLLMHGDTLCTRDINYLKARKKLRNKFLQTLFLLLPLNTRKKLADNMRKMSMQHTANVDAEIMDVTQEEVEKKMRLHGVRYLIHGHTHQLGFHEFSLDQSQGFRIVLGAWHTRGNMLVWDESGKRNLVELR